MPFKSGWTWIRFVFAGFCALGVIDLILLVGSGAYRNIYGTTRGPSDSMWRAGLDIAMIFFYGIVVLKMKRISFLPRLILWHGIVYELLGLVLCIPFGGYFISPLTPAEILILAPILWLSFGYYFYVGVAISFVCFNVYLVWAAISWSRSRQTHT